MKIRQARITDLELLSELFDAYRVLSREDSDVDKARAFLTERLSNRDSEFFVCETNNSI